MIREQNLQTSTKQAVNYDRLLPAVFQKELDKLSILNINYKEHLDKVVDKIEKIYGKTPYEVDCDFFIDTYCQGAGNMTVDKLNEEMTLLCR